MGVGDVLQASIQYSINGDKVCNVLHFQQTSSDGAIPPPKDLGLAIIEDLVPTLKAVLSNDCTITQISCRRVAPTKGGGYDVPCGVAGTVSIDTAPPQVCMLATLYSETQGKQGRGRIYIPAVPDTWLTGGTLIVSHGATYVAFLNALMAVIQAGSGATFQAGVYHEGGTFHDFTSHKLRSWSHTMRSRRMANP